MKNIYKILLLVVVITFGSCAVNDDDPVTAPNINTISASLANRVERIAAADNSFDLTVSFSEAVNQRARITYTLDGAEMTVDANAGSSQATIRIDMSNDTFRTIVITKMQMLYANEESVETMVSVANNTTTVVKGDDVIAQMTWSDGTDIDLVLTNAPAPASPYTLTLASQIDVSLSVGPLETVVLPGNMPDGDYSVSIIPYQAFNNPIEFTLQVFAGSQAFSFTGTVDSGQAATGGFFSPLVYNTVVEFAKITKTTNGGLTSYAVVNQL